MSAVAKIILGRTLLKALAEANIIRESDQVRRVVIDAPVSGAVVVYVERYGDDRLLQVVPTLDGVEISAIPA